MNCIGEVTLHAIQLLIYLLFFQIASLSTVGFMTLARLLVVIDPLGSRFRIFSFTVKSLLSVFFSLSVTSVLLTGFIVHMSETKLLPNGLCSIFYDPMGQAVYSFSAVGLSILQFITCCGVILMYVAIYKQNKSPHLQKKTSGVKKSLQRKCIFQIIFITGSNIACWVPSCIIYMFFALRYKFSSDILLYTTIYITPVNSVVNPVLIIFINRVSNAKSTLTEASNFSHNNRVNLV